MRLLINGDWYEAISSDSQYESDFETMILNNSSTLFPEYIALPFKVRVESDHDTKIPDFALVDRQYRHWWVVEVEMAHHPLQNHVLPQIETFAAGNYGREHAEYLARQSTVIDLDRAYDLVRGEMPRVLVVVNQSVPSWVEPIHRLNGLLSIVEVFRSSRNQHVMRVNGDRLVSNPTNELSKCRLDPLMPRLLQVDSPAALGVTDGARVSILYKHGYTEWQRMGVSNQVWLHPIHRNPLKRGCEYSILRGPDGIMCIEEDAP